MTQASFVSSVRTAPSRGLDLDALAAMQGDELAALYAAAPAPTEVTPLEGNPLGRMLAVRGLDDGVAASLLRAFAGSSAFVWGGKSFFGKGARGTGSNRVHLGGRHQLFPFLTRIDASAVDGKPTLVLDYDLPDNPRVIGKIHDEIREVEKGLWLGPAMWKSGERRVHVLWFALDTRVPAKPVGHARA